MREGEESRNLSTTFGSLQRMLHDDQSVTHWRFGVVITGLIVMSVVLIALEPMVSKSSMLFAIFGAIDDIFLWLFVLEFALRFATVPVEIPRTVELTWAGRVIFHIHARVKFCFYPWSLIDLSAIIALVPGLRSLRILRLLRLLRTIRFFRYYDPLKTLSNAIRSNALLLLFTFSFLALAVVTGALGLYAAEGGTNESVQNIYDSFYWAIVTLTTVGYGDISPQSFGGRIVAIGLMFAGMGVMALFVGVISQTLVGHIMPLRAEQIRMSTISNHLLVCGWNNNVPLLLEELNAEYKDELPEVIVFAPLERPTTLDERYQFVPGDPTKENELDKVRMAYAQTVLIVGHQAERFSSPSAVDATTVLTLFTLRSYESKLAARGTKRTGPLHLCCEIHDPENIDHARTAGANDIILTSRLSAGLLAHASAFPGMSGVFSEILSPTHQNIYVEPISEALRQKTEGLSVVHLRDALQEHHQALMIGFSVGDDVRINPPFDTQIPANASVVYLAARPVSPKSRRLG